MADIEEELEVKAWADRNAINLDHRFTYTPVEALRAHELKTYRDCPIGYEDDETRFGLLACLLAAVALSAAVVLGWVVFHHH